VQANSLTGKQLAESKQIGEGDYSKNPAKVNKSQSVHLGTETSVVGELF